VLQRGYFASKPLASRVGPCSLPQAQATVAVWIPPVPSIPPWVLVGVFVQYAANVQSIKRAGVLIGQLMMGRSEKAKCSICGELVTRTFEVAPAPPCASGAAPADGARLTRRSPRAAADPGDCGHAGQGGDNQLRGDVSLQAQAVPRRAPARRATGARSAQCSAACSASSYDVEGKEPPQKDSSWHPNPKDAASGGARSPEIAAGSASGSAAALRRTDSIHAMRVAPPMPDTSSSCGVRMRRMHGRRGPWKDAVPCERVVGPACGTEHDPRVLTRSVGPPAGYANATTQGRATASVARSDGEAHPAMARATMRLRRFGRVAPSRACNSRNGGSCPSRDPVSALRPEEGDRLVGAFFRRSGSRLRECASTSAQKPSVVPLKDSKPALTSAQRPEDPPSALASGGATKIYSNPICAGSTIGAAHTGRATCDLGGRFIALPIRLFLVL